MRILIGTSGYQYTAWRGHFYSITCKERDMLGAYAQQLPSVEVNNTFYRTPKPELLGKWAAQVPSDFRFAIKAPKRITHVLRLRHAQEALASLFRALEQLGDKLGCVLFQLPPSLPKDSDRLREFLQWLPSSAQVSFEFRHDSWNDSEVLDLLRAHGAALCSADRVGSAMQLQSTADFGYLRLRRDTYSDEELRALHDRVGEQAWREVYAYFKDGLDAPDLARRLSALFERPGPGLAKTTLEKHGSARDTAKAVS
jgi:uncharacterized protein YecE (DUF72 family)